MMNGIIMIREAREVRLHLAFGENLELLEPPLLNFCKNQSGGDKKDHFGSASPRHGWIPQDTERKEGSLKKPWNL